MTAIPFNTHGGGEPDNTFPTQDDPTQAYIVVNKNEIQAGFDVSSLTSSTRNI